MCIFYIILPLMVMYIFYLCELYRLQRGRLDGTTASFELLQGYFILSNSDRSRIDEKESESLVELFEALFYELMSKNVTLY